MGKIPSNQTTKITLRVNKDFRDRYKAQVASMSDDLRKHMARTITGTEDTDLLKEKEIARCYKILKDYSDPSGRIDTDLAESLIADNMNIPKETVRTNVLENMRHRDMITPVFGRIQLHKINPDTED